MATVLKEPQSITVTPISGALGAKVEGVDLSRPVSDEAMSQLRQAFLDYCVLLFPGQEELTPEQHVAFAARWGTVHEMPTP